MSNNQLHLAVMENKELGPKFTSTESNNTSFTLLGFHTYSLNPLFALDIFICSFRKCIQHTTRGQSNFPLSKLCYCYIFIELKYWWQNSITAHIYANCDWGIVNRWVTRWVKMVQKEGKRSFEGFRGIIILLILPKAQSLSLGQALRLGQACQLPGHHSCLR